MISWTTAYRPRRFAELQLANVRETMLTWQREVAFPRVLLFTGPKGTGKTSTARILAATLNTPANQRLVDDHYLRPSATPAPEPLADPETERPEILQILQGDSYAVVEIDAASHRGIDDVRALQEQVYVPPSLSRVLVYILDEVHMFTTEAFNALLKVLEEPPAHAFFILATTEFHKIPATVVSRCQVVNFRRATSDELVATFQRILADQKISAEPAALAELATLADGSFRDGVKFLQTVASQGEITSAAVEKILVGDCRQQIETLVDIIIAKDAARLLDFFAELRSLNFDSEFFTKSFYQYLYAQLVANVKGEGTPKLNAKQTKFLLKSLLGVTSSAPIPFLGLELALLDIFDQAGKKAAS